MEIRYNVNLAKDTFENLDIGDMFTFETKEVYIKTKFFTVCNREGVSPSRCSPIDYNAYNLSTNSFTHFKNEQHITKVKGVLTVE